MLISMDNAEEATIRVDIEKEVDFLIAQIEGKSEKQLNGLLDGNAKPMVDLTINTSNEFEVCVDRLSSSEARKSYRTLNNSLMSDVLAKKLNDALRPIAKHDVYVPRGLHIDAYDNVVNEMIKEFGEAREEASTSNKSISYFLVEQIEQAVHRMFEKVDYDITSEEKVLHTYVAQEMINDFADYNEMDASQTRSQTLDRDLSWLEDYKAGKSSKDRNDYIRTTENIKNDDPAIHTYDWEPKAPGAVFQTIKTEKCR